MPPTTIFCAGLCWRRAHRLRVLSMHRCAQPRASAAEESGLASDRLFVVMPRARHTDAQQWLPERFADSRYCCAPPRACQRSGRRGAALVWAAPSGADEDADTAIGSSAPCPRPVRRRSAPRWHRCSRLRRPCATILRDDLAAPQTRVVRCLAHDDGDGLRSGPESPRRPRGVDTGRCRPGSCASARSSPLHDRRRARRVFEMMQPDPRSFLDRDGHPRYSAT